MSYSRLDAVIDRYIDSRKDEFPENGAINESSIDPICLAKEKLKMDIIEEVVAEKQAEYKEIVLNEMRLELEKKRIRQIQTFIIDGIIIGFLIGLIANQGTEVINCIKCGGKISQELMIATGIVFVVVLFIMALLLKFQYFNKINDFISLKEKK